MSRTLKLLCLHAIKQERTICLIQTNITIHTENEKCQRFKRKHIEKYSLYSSAELCLWFPQFLQSNSECSIAISHCRHRFNRTEGHKEFTADLFQMKCDKIIPSFDLDTTLGIHLPALTQISKKNLIPAQCNPQPHTHTHTHTHTERLVLFNIHIMVQLLSPPPQ